MRPVGPFWGRHADVDAEGTSPSHFVSFFGGLVHPNAASAARTVMDTRVASLTRPSQIEASGVEKIRVVIVDDHPAIREALTDTLSSKMDMEFAGEAESAGDAMRVINKVRPDVAIVDISLKDAHGLDLVQNIRIQYPEVQVVVFSMYDESAYAERAVRAGALGYVMKNSPTQSVVEAIRCAMRGEVYLSRRMASRILTKVVRGRSSQGFRFSVDDLTDREMAVFQMLGQGHGVDEIAERLNLSRKTVETYRRRAKEKLGFDTVSELLQHAIHWTSGHA
jgi:DNA-binding NarL/FixJ family response regulator